MNVSIGKQFEEFVNSLVGDGRYASASEVIREGLRLVQEREAKLQALRETINASIERGGRITPEEMRAHFEARTKAWEEKNTDK
ncbi:MAG: type II toxin-antitoxin system ParD family antitoxin [Alphaproteobacteria bacterium]|nr:type II toxin-antitoxin system ParD family antitoxin [Alphaproteobacteria bacterium]